MGFDEIQFELGVATQCGRCEACARAVVKECSATAPTAHLSLDTPVQKGKAWITSAA